MMTFRPQCGNNVYGNQHATQSQRPLYYIYCKSHLAKLMGSGLTPLKSELNALQCMHSLLRGRPDWAGWFSHVVSHTDVFPGRSASASSLSQQMASETTGIFLVSTYLISWGSCIFNHTTVLDLLGNLLCNFVFLYKYSYGYTATCGSTM